MGEKITVSDGHAVHLVENPTPTASTEYWLESPMAHAASCDALFIFLRAICEFDGWIKRPSKAEVVVGIQQLGYWRTHDGRYKLGDHFEFIHANNATSPALGAVFNSWRWIRCGTPITLQMTILASTHSVGPFNQTKDARKPQSPTTLCSPDGHQGRRGGRHLGRRKYRPRRGGRCERDLVLGVS